MVLEVNRRNEILKLAREAKALKRMKSLEEKEEKKEEEKDKTFIMKVSDGIITYNEDQKSLNFTLKDLDNYTSSTDSSISSNEEPKKRTQYLGTYKKYYLDIPYSLKDSFKEKYNISFDKKDKVWYWEGKKTNMPSALKKRIIT